MLRKVVIHIANEQPIVADLLVEPKPSDVALICSNLRTLGGKKPVFIDKTESTFVLPLAHIRFVEIPQASMAEMEAERAALGSREASTAEPDYETGALERLAWLTGGEPPAPADEPEATPAGESTAAGSDELDEELLRRIHEV